MTTLQQFTDWWAAIEARVEEADGVVTPEIQAELESYAFLEKEKVDGYVAVIKNLETKIIASQLQQNELAKKHIAWLNQVRWLKTNAERHMNVTGVTELSGVVWKFQIQKNGGIAPLVGPGVENPELLPAMFQKLVVTPRIDALRDYCEHHGQVIKTGDDGQPIVVARLGERGTHLRIR